MMHTTIGLDIGKNAVRCAVCNVDGQKVEIVTCLQEPVTESGLGQALTDISKKITDSRIQIDAIGATLDPTLMLSAHRTMPFNDPRAIEQVLPQFLGDVWNIDENAQVAFDVGAFVEDKSAEDADNKDGDGPVGGYDVYAIHYPRSNIAELIDLFKESRIDPHVMLPSTEAMSFGIGPILDAGNGCWCLLDIGADITTLYVVCEGKLALSRAFRVGSSNIDTELAAAFKIEPAEARSMKERTGFVAAPGNEALMYQRYVQSRRLEQWDINPVVMSQTCMRGLSMLFSSFRQTLINFATKNRIEPTMLYLTGNGAKLVGLDEVLAQFSGIRCSLELPLSAKLKQSFNDVGMVQKLGTEAGRDNVLSAFSLDAACVANAAAQNIDGKCPLNLRRGALAHKGSLAFIQDNKWLLAALAVGLIAMLIFMTVTKIGMINAEHDRIKAALEQASQDVFGKKMVKYSDIEAEFNQSKGYDFIPEITAFTHFRWLSDQITMNLSDVELDIQSLDINNLQKTVTIQGDVTGDEGLTKFLQLLEQYECFPDEIDMPRTSLAKDRTHFTGLKIQAHHCMGNGGDNE